MREAFLTDEQWAKIQPLLPKHRSKGRPWANNREVLEGILEGSGQRVSGVTH